MMLIFSIVIWNPGNIWAWNCRGLVDVRFPEFGLKVNKTRFVERPCTENELFVDPNAKCFDFEKYWVPCKFNDDWDCLGTHEWIVNEAVEYLKDNGYIPAESWFDRVDFTMFLQWGVAYADHTGRKISAGFGISFDWDIDGFRHFYHPDSIWVTLLEGDWGDTDFAHVGELTAPEYAKQLYNRAVEFWPNGTPPLDLTTLKTARKTWRLGYTWDAPDETPYIGWAEGTDPRLIEAPHELGDPDWPPWVVDNQEDKETAAIFLGWALHMVQDMSVYHHTKNLHGFPHQDYESDVEEMVSDNETIFGKQLPIPPSGKPFCVAYASCEKGSPACCELKGFTHCYDIFPDYASYNLDSFDAESLANAVASYTWKQAKENVPDKKFPVGCFGDTDPQPSGIPSYFSFKNKAYVKHSLDAAIKASAALIYKFINDVSQEELPDDRFEPNDDYYHPRRLSPGSYYDLTISDELDNDYYLIEMPYQGDLEIRIDYDRKLAGIGVWLDGPYNPYVPKASTQGEIFKLKGIAPGEYLLHLQPSAVWDAPTNGADVTTTYYDLHITIGGKRLDADDWEDNDSPQTADERLCRYNGYTPDLTIDEVGDDDYYLVRADIGYRIDASITFNPLEGELRLFFNNEEVTEKQTKQEQSYILDADFLFDGGPSIKRKVLQELQNTPSLSPSPIDSGLSNKTLSISRCSSGRDIIRITGEPNYYSISVSKKADFDHCLPKFSPTRPRGISPPSTTIRPSTPIRPKPIVNVPPSTEIKPKPFPRVPPSTTIKPKPVPRVPPSTTIRPKPVVKVPPSTTIQPKPVAKVPPSTTIQPKPVVKVSPSTTIQPKPVAKVPPSTTIQPKPVLKSTVQMQRTYR